MLFNPPPLGWIEVICGPMFSGKTEELIRRLRRAAIARQRAAVFKPSMDDRFEAANLVSHSQQRLECIPVSTPSQILEQLQPGVQVVGIDEAQFFGPELVEICEDLADRGLRVVVAGLDQDYTGTPFAPMPKLLALAEQITKLLAICVRCGAPAGRSFRITSEEGQLLVGASDKYEARCRRCFERPEPSPKKPVQQEQS